MRESEVEILVSGARSVADAIAVAVCVTLLRYRRFVVNSRAEHEFVGDVSIHSLGGYNGAQALCFTILDP